MLAGRVAVAMTPDEIQVCLRPFTPQDVQKRQQEILDRVGTLAADGQFDSTVVWWSPKVCPPDTDNPLGAGCPPVVVELLELAKRDDFSLEPFVRNHSGAVPGEDDSLVLPVISLLVRTDGDIDGLYPVALGERTYTVEDGLTALEAGEDASNLAAARL